MSAYPTSIGQLTAPQPPRKHYWQRLGGKFLILSILAHLLLGFMAAYYVIHTFVPAKKAFQSIMPTISPVIKAEEQKKQVNERATASMPTDPARRITSLGMASVTILDIPKSPAANAVTITPMTGGPGLSGYQSGGGPGTSAGPQGGPGVYVGKFGGNSYIPGALQGTFYDLKFTSGRRDSGMTFGKYADTVNQFVKGNWNDSILSRYLKGSRPLYATQIFFPEIESSEGPAAFNSPMPQSEGMWVAVYKGMVSPPESGTYHFVGAGDDDMIVRFDGKLVLHKCEHIDPLVQAEGVYHYTGLRNEFGRSTAVTVEAGKYYPVEILIGDHIPTKTMAVLLIEKEGVNYQKDGDAPVLPPFAIDAAQSQPVVSPDTLPAHVSNGPAWKGKSTSTSLLDQIDQ